jgi:hypothetical protein
MVLNLVAWLTAPEDVRERRARIAEYLTNEGHQLPPSPPGADYDEAGTSHLVRGQEMTVAYSVVDQGGRCVYYYAEYEVDHIMLRRIRRGEEWTLEHMGLIPAILRRGRVVVWEIGHVIYESRRQFRPPDGGQYRLRVVVQQRKDGRWWVSSFHPRPSE